MAIAFDTSVNQQTNGGTSSLTYSYTCTGANGCLVVAALIQSSQTITGITYAGSAMTQAASVSTTNVSAGETSYVFVLGAPATGANNVVITGSGAATIASVASSYTGAQSVSNVEASNTATGTGTNGTASVTTTTDNDWLVAYCRSNATVTSAGANTTLRGTPTALTMADSNAAQTPPGSFAQNFTAATGAQWGIIVVAIKPFAAAAAAGGTLLMMGV